MIFIRVVPALLVAAISAQALYIPDVLYAREFEESRDVAAREPSERGLDHPNLVRDLASNNGGTVLAARGDEEHNSVNHHPHREREGKTATKRLLRGGQKVKLQDIRLPAGIRLPVGITRNGRSGRYRREKKEDGRN